MFTIHADTFTADETQSEINLKWGWTDGTIEVTFNRSTRRVDAVKYEDGRIGVRGMVARYPTGSKVWPASVMCNPDGSIFYIRAGVESRSGRIAAQPRLCGFREDVREEYVSQR